MALLLQVSVSFRKNVSHISESFFLKNILNENIDHQTFFNGQISLLIALP